jgi:nucleoid DNA-binding protein
MEYIMRICIAFLSLFFLFSCNYNQEKMPDHVVLADKITKKYTEQIKNDENLLLNGFGSNYVNGIHRIGLDFQTERTVDITEARYLLVRSVSKLLDAVNSNEEIRRYLDHYPYTAKGIEFAIDFSNKNMHECKIGSIAYVYVFHNKRANENIVLYKAYDLTKRNYVEVHRETYEEAERIVQIGG